MSTSFKSDERFKNQTLKHINDMRAAEPTVRFELLGVIPIDTDTIRIAFTKNDRLDYKLFPIMDDNLVDKIEEKK